MNSPAIPQSAPAEPQAVGLARRLVDEVWNQQDEGAVTALMPHSFAWNEDRTIGPTRVSGMGGRSMLQEVRANHAAFPDFEVNVTDAFWDDQGRALVLIHASGTHTGEVRLGNNRVTDGKVLEASGAKLQATGWLLVKTRDGKILGVSPSWNPRSLLQQAAGVEPEDLA
ncbi:MAG: ester cyclase [Acidobacteriota bacterium]